MSMSLEELNVVLNSWPEGTRGHAKDREALGALDALGKKMGYGWLQLMAVWLRDIQCYGEHGPAAAMKRSRFESLGWPLPEDFEEVVRHHSRGISP